MLSPDELNIVIAEIKDRAERTATSRIAGPKPKQQAVIKKEKPTPKPKGTTSKSGSSGATAPARSTSAAIVTSPVHPTQVPLQGLVSKELKSPPPQSIQHSSAGIREQSNPRGTAQRSDSGLMSYFQRGRLPGMGQGTPSVAPEQAKGAVPRPQSVDTPPRSRSAERKGGTFTPRADTPSRSRSAERGNTPAYQSTPIIPVTTAWLDAAPRRPSSRDPPREPPATAEGLGSIVIGGNEEQTSDPPQEAENRSPSMGTIGRGLSAISIIGRGPQTPRPTRGRSAERTQGGAPPPPQGDSEGDSSSYGSEVRAHQNPVVQEPEIPAVAQGPRLPAIQRPEVPPPPSFYEDFTYGRIPYGCSYSSSTDPIPSTSRWS